MMTRLTYTRKALVFLLFLLSYTVLTADDPVSTRMQIDQQAEEIIASLESSNPGFSDDLDAAVGYFAGKLLQVQMAVAGAGAGTGVLVDKESGNRVYLDIIRLDLGVGFGAQSLKAAILIHDPAVLDKLKSGKWSLTMGAEAVATGESAAARLGGRGYSAYAFSEEGLLAAASVRVFRFRLNPELNSLGLSDFNIPNRPRPLDVDEIPGTWDRPLPFLAQKVIDNGYKLPLPFGVGAVYAHTEQEQKVDNLRIGFGGSDKVPIKAIVFKEVISTTNAFQYKMDAWVFPFMNVFGTVGYIEGKGPITFVIDGDTLLEDLGVNCGGIISHPLCKILGGKSVTIPVKASFQGMTYTVGTLLAGGWRGWFGTIPLTFTYTDLKDSVTDGYTTAIVPRVGRVIPLEGYGNLAVFLGAQFLHSDLEIDGNYTFPGTEVTVEYLISQKNKDQWALTLGYNWEISRNWSWSFEYSGFIGSRKNFITTAGYRF